MKMGRSLPLLAIALVAGLLMVLFVLLRLFAAPTPAESLEALTATPDWQNVVLVTVLVGISVVLFVYQLGWGALRVTATVALALALGYLVTIFFNLDTANRYISGEFRVALISQAAPVAADDMDLEYGRERGDEFNEPGVRQPVTTAAYRFTGSQGDVVTILAYAASRRSEVNVQVALQTAAGVTLAEATTSTTAQREQFEDMRSERDAAIQDFTLPEDGVYVIVAQPEPLSTGTILSEAIASTGVAYEAFLLGPVQRLNRWAVWIQDALTLILVGLAIAIVFRAKQFSLGAEGQLYFGALVSGAICLSAGQWPLPLVLAMAIGGAMVAGFLWGLLPGALKAYLGANELVSTLMLNVIAVRFFELVLTFQLKPPEAGYISSAPFAENAQMPAIIAGTQVTIAVFLVIVAVIVVWLLITRTPLGYEIRTVGVNLKFADYGGINTRRTVMLAMAVSGLVAGLAGAHLSMGIFRQLVIGLSVGLAFEGVVVALLARNNPLVIPFTGLLYAYLRAGAQFMERDASVSFEVVRIIQAVIILLITAEALAAYFQLRRQQKPAQG